MSYFRCVSCGSLKTEVIDNQSSGAFRRRRRRKCTCGHRFSTIELPLDELSLLNADGALIAKLHRDAKRVTDTVEKVLQSRKAALE